MLSQVLDQCCGNGTLQIALTKHIKCKTFGIDINNDYIETLKSISAKLGVDEAGERNDYRANESCMIETPIGWYFLNLEYSRISIDYCSVTAPLLPVLINTEGLSVDTIKETTLSHLKEISQQYKDTYLYGHSKDIAFIQNDLSKVSVEDVYNFNDRDDFLKCVTNEDFICI